jgi:hypothetical protein
MVRPLRTVVSVDVVSLCRSRRERDFARLFEIMGRTDARVSAISIGDDDSPCGAIVAPIMAAPQPSVLPSQRVR